MPNLRGHHLICLHFFDGEGYDGSFVRNLRSVIETVNQEMVIVCRGADDVCGSCPHLRDAQCGYSETADEEIRDMDEAALKLLNLAPDAVVEWDIIRDRLQGVFNMWHEKYCQGCEWKRACEQNELYRQLSNSGKNSDNKH